MSSQDKHISRVLLCAYACSPDRGSEESVGWDTAVQLASRDHQVVVLTRSTERTLSEAKAESIPDELRPTFVSCDLSPVWTNLLGHLGKIGVDLGYFAWLLKARRQVKDLHRAYQFTSSQHVTYARYWMPSPLSSLDIPFIWGPVGGGESIPAAFLNRFSLKGRAFEALRDMMRSIGESMTLAQNNAKRSHIALANTAESAKRMKLMGAESIQIMNSAALSEKDQQTLQKEVIKQDRLTFISVGRLLEWKGFQLGLEAFSRANLPNARYLIVGSGPFKANLVALVQKLSIQNQVDFIASMPRNELFDLMISAHALVHPSMHESGGYVCLEMMAAGNPVICLNVGGPSLFVSDSSGFLASTEDYEQALNEMASFMSRLESEPNLGMRLGQHGKQRVQERFSMSVKSNDLSLIHGGAVQDSVETRVDAPPALRSILRSSTTSSAPNRPVSTPQVSV